MAVIKNTRVTTECNTGVLIYYNNVSYIKNPSRIPAATAEPITPATFGPIACISKQLVESYSKPITCEIRAESGTAETPALPINGLILLPFFKKILNILTKITPDAVAMMNDNAPRAKILIESSVRNSEACVEAPTVRPNRIVIVSINGPLAVLA